MASTITVDKIKGGSSGVALTLPTADGSAGQLLKTNGSAVLSWATDSTTDSTKLPLAGGALTGAITTNSTFDGVDIAVRDAILTSTTTTAGAALPKAGGTMTGTTVLKGITETEATNSTTTYTVDLANGTIFDLTSASAVAITMPAEVAGKAFTIIVKTAPASWTSTPAILWASGTVPSATTISIYSFLCDGTTWYGMEAGNGFA
jgi:hypothetical protein